MKSNKKEFEQRTVSMRELTQLKVCEEKIDKMSKIMILLFTEK